MRFMSGPHYLLVIKYCIRGIFGMLSQPLLDLKSLVTYKIAVAMHVQNLLEGQVGNCTVNSTGILAVFPHSLQTVQYRLIRFSFKRNFPGRRDDDMCVGSLDDTPQLSDTFRSKQYSEPIPPCLSAIRQLLRIIKGIQYSVEI